MPKASLAAIVKHCDRLLRTNQIKDYDGAANGLQVENCGAVTRIAATVDASLATIKMAVVAKADLLIVHHGLFWSLSTFSVDRARCTRYAARRLLRNTQNVAVYSSHPAAGTRSSTGSGNQSR
jgi:putative NIF3 family GTP cyclohydrolase 1 type 2